MTYRGYWAYASEEDSDLVALTDVGIALHLLKSVFFLNGRSKKHWNPSKHPRDSHGRWARTYGAFDEPSVGRSNTQRVYGTRKNVTIGSGKHAQYALEPGDRLYETSSGSHVVVHPDGSGTAIAKDGSKVKLTSKGVDAHMGKDDGGKSSPKLVDSQPGILVNAKSNEEAEKLLKKHEEIDKKYHDKHKTDNYTPKHSASKSSESSDDSSKAAEGVESSSESSTSSGGGTAAADSQIDYEDMGMQPGDELRRNAKDNNQTMILHPDGSSTLFDASTGKETNNSASKTQGILLGNKDVSDAVAGKKSWSSVNTKGIKESQQTIDKRWPIIHKEPMSDTNFDHPEHGKISAKYSDAKNIVAKEHPKGIAVKDTRTGSTLLHKKDGTVSRFNGSDNDFNALPDAKQSDNKRPGESRDKIHEHQVLGGTTSTDIGSKPHEKNSYRQKQQEAAKGINNQILGGIDSTGNLVLPEGTTSPDTIVIENEAELRLIMQTFERLGIKEINGIPLAEYFNVKGKKQK